MTAKKVHCSQNSEFQFGLVAGRLERRMHHSLAGISVRLPREVGDYSLSVTPGGIIKIDVDLARIPSLLEEMGYSEVVLLLTRVSNCTILTQMYNPTVNAPPGLDLDQTGTAFLQLLEMTLTEAQHFRRNVDWASTLVLPIPSNARSKEVQVDGVDGGMIVPLPYSPSTLLIWVKDEMLYSLQTSEKSQVALESANTLR
jgi:hypothetical protein